MTLFWIDSQKMMLFHLFQEKFHINMKGMNTNTKRHTFKIQRYQLLLMLIYCLIDYKGQGQTFNHLVIDIHNATHGILLNTCITLMKLSIDYLVYKD